MTDEVGPSLYVTDEHVAFLRAFLTRDDAELDRLSAQPDPPDTQQGFYLLLSAAFCTAVLRRFGRDRQVADIIRVVAAVRGRLGDRADDLDPIDAERLIQAVLIGPSAMAELTDDAKQAQIPLLAELIVDEQLDEAGMDTFLAQSHELADKMARAKQNESAGR